MKSVYESKLDAVVERYRSMHYTSGGGVLKQIVNGLESDSAIGGMLFNLDQEVFDAVIDLLVEFRRTGRNTPFNSLHAAARAAVARKGRAVVDEDLKDLEKWQ